MNFSPFYTRQPNEDSRQRQLEKWSTIIKDYCKLHSISRIDAQNWQQTTLFANQVLDRKCHIDFIKEILVYMEQHKYALITTQNCDIPSDHLIIKECKSGGYISTGIPNRTYVVVTYTVSEVIDSLNILPPQLYTGFELRNEQYFGNPFNHCPIEILIMALDELEKLKKVKLIRNANFDETGIKVL